MIRFEEEEEEEGADSFFPSSWKCSESVIHVPSLVLLIYNTSRMKNYGENRSQRGSQQVVG
jgi:hypothetical protein